MTLRLKSSLRKGRFRGQPKRRSKLAVNQFQLDNQKLGLFFKSLTRVLAIPRIDVQGKVLLDGKSLRPQGVTLTLPHSKFIATGKVDFATGLDLHAGGQALLDDVAMIADNELRGEGTVTAHIRGTFEDVFVDFDADLKLNTWD